jgi:hypothetical protein
MIVANTLLIWLKSQKVFVDDSSSNLTNSIIIFLTLLILLSSIPKKKKDIFSIFIGYPCPFQKNSSNLTNSITSGVQQQR